MGGRGGMCKERLLRILAFVSIALIIILLCAAPALAAVSGFVTSGSDGELYEYDYAVLLDAYVSLILGAAAPVYADYSQKSMYAFLDDQNGYVDYSDVLDAYVKAILDSRGFDVNRYTAGAGALKASMPGEVYVVAQDSGGKLTYTKKILQIAGDVVAAMKAVNAATSATAMKTALCAYEDVLALNLNRYSLTAGEQEALGGRLLALKPFASAGELQRILQVMVIAIRGGFTVQYTPYSCTLGAMVDKQMAVNPQTDRYGGGWKSARREDVTYFLDPYNFLDMEYGGSAAGSVRITADPNLKLRQRPTTASPQIQDDGGGLLSAWKGEVFAILGQAGAEAGTEAGTEGTWYRIKVRGKEGWVCGKYCQLTGDTLSLSPMFQFLLLSGSAGTTVADLNKILAGKGILSGKGQAFMEAAGNNNINEIFLVSLGLHESGNGTSELATGIDVADRDSLYPGAGGTYTRAARVKSGVSSLTVRQGPTTASGPLVDAAGNAVAIGPSSEYTVLGEQAAAEGTLPETAGIWYRIRVGAAEGWVCGAHVNVTTYVRVYNMFGIGAYDDNPKGNGAAKAYAERWLTPEAAILGGARFAASNYINRPSNAQDTLYKMRWNPQSPATHQYATDIGWASKQVPRIKELYDQVGTCHLTFDIPRYRE